MDHQWRPCPIQGDICPTCSIPHFPLCPSPASRFSGPGFGPNQAPVNTARPSFQGSGDPYYDPGYWNRNPSLSQMGDFGTVNRGPYSMQNPGYSDGGYVGSEHNVNDRSSKKLRVDGTYAGSYGDEIDANLPRVPQKENERRLKLVRDHGGPNFYLGFNRDVRGYGQESLVFDNNVDGREPWKLTNMGMRNNPDTGHGVNYHREEIGNHTGYESRHGMRSASGVQGGSLANKIEHRDLQPSQWGQVVKPFHQGGVRHDKDSHSHEYHNSAYGSSHFPSEGFYNHNFEPRHPSDVALHYEQRSITSISTQYSGSQPPFPDAMQQPGEMRYDYHSPSHFNSVRKFPEGSAGAVEGYQGSFGNQNVPIRPLFVPSHVDNQGGYGNSVSESMGHLRPSQGFDVWPPLPASPPPPMPMEPLKVSASLFPIAVSSAVDQSSYAPTSEPNMNLAQRHLQNSHLSHPARVIFQTDSQATLSSSRHYLREDQRVPSKSNFTDKAKVIDASHLFKTPHRATRPDHFVIILRGLPGSGKSYLAKMLRDLEVEHGGNAPRIHSMDDYFMTEVEKAEENEVSKSSLRGKKPAMKKVLEYCYEPEMEEAYRASMLRAFKKTLEEGVFTFVIVDDRNLRVADFAQFWATAKRSGYEVYVLEAPYKDPVGCTARNVHGFTQDDVEKMAAQWEEAPSLYLLLDVKSLFHGDDLAESNIQEVDMETEDGDIDEDLPRLEERAPEKIVAFADSPKDERGWDDEGENPTEEVKDLGRSKWSSNLDEEDDEGSEALKGKPNVLSGLLRTYAKEGKSVHWSDQGGHIGFSIGAIKKANPVSLVIGPGAGYNLISNPLPEEEVEVSAKSGETRKHSVFKERLRAEQESFKAVFDGRRQRIGGFDGEEE